MVFLVLAVLVSGNLMISTALATTRYVDATTTGCSTPSDTDYDPNTGTCGSGASLVYNAIATALSAASGGDRIIITSGTYTGTSNRVENIPSGVQGNPTIIEGDPSSSSTCAKSSTCLTTIQNDGVYGIYIKASSYVLVRNLKVSGATNGSYPICTGCQSSTSITGNSFDNVEITLGGSYLTNGASGIMDSPQVSFTRVSNSNIHHNGNIPVGGGHGLYIQGDNFTIENSWVHHNANYGMQCYNSGAVSDGMPDRCHVNYTIIEDNGSHGLFMEGDDDEVVGSIIRNNPDGINSGSNGAARLKIVNNVVVGTISIGTFGSAVDSIVQNNIVYGSVIAGASSSATMTSSFNACRSGDSCGSNKLTYAALTDIFVSSSDFSLKQGSPAIDAGTTSAVSTVRPCNGVCDIGAFESIPNPTATITENRVTLTFPMNTAVPIQNISTAGATVACTGSACPASPSVSAAARSVGTDTVVELTISGISGNACAAANQTWTTSYDSTLGSWSSTDNIGTSNQKVFSYTNLSVTNNCTGSPPSGYPAGYHLYYKFDDGSGTNANDESANNLDGTLTGGPIWGSGKTGSAVITTSGTSQYVAVPYGNGVNPSTQSLTIAFGVNVPAGQESSSRGEFGTSVGTNQRLLIQAVSGTWRLGIQSSNAGSGASSLAVTSGWNHLCLKLDSGTDTATLYLNGIAGTGSASKSYTSYALPSNFTLGLYDINTSPGGTYDDFIVYTSAEDCGAIYTAFQGTATAPTGTLSQEAIQFQDVYLPSVGGGPTNLAPMNGAQSVVSNGAVAVLFQIHCENIADCDPTAFKLTYKRNGSSTKITVPNTETSDGIWMWGNDSNSFLNTGATTTRLTGTCAVTNGTTQLTADQVPSVDLPQDGCIMLRYIVRVRTANDYFDLSLQTASGLDLPGGYDHEARINVIGTQASGGF